MVVYASAIQAPQFVLYVNFFFAWYDCDTLLYFSKFRMAPELSSDCFGTASRKDVTHINIDPAGEMVGAI